MRCRDFLNTGPVSITTRSFSLSLVNLHGIEETIYVIPDKRPVIVRDATESGGWRTYENQYRRKDGSIINCILELRSYTNPASGRTELEGFIVEISESKRAEEVLRESERSYRWLFNAIPAGHLYSRCENGTFLNLN